MIRTLFLLLMTWLFLAPARAADPFTLADGDRAVLVGNTLIEREQRHGYWEALLTGRYPDKSVAFRNLGWSGDTVFGTARAGFGTAADGFRSLKEHVHGLKPTVIVVGYGANEAFDGPAGLPRFQEGLNALLDMMAETKAKIIILSPLRQEDLGRPLPDPTEQNKNLKLYRDALRQAAEKRGHPFVDLYDLLHDGKAKPAGPLTDNGIHLTAYGYWHAAAALERGLGLGPPRWRVEVDVAAKKGQAQGATLEQDPATPTRFRITDNTLPVPPPPADAPKGASLPGRERLLRVRGLADGKYTLHIDGKPVLTATAAEWAAGVALTRGPEFDQAERLREAVVAKNRDYFHRWRPQNETYLFGFRKHEQGHNAKELAQFEPIVEKLEEEIAKLRKPAAHGYELEKEK